MQDLKFENYNKIEDIIYYLGPNAVLKMNLNLYSNSEKYGRRSYHQELEYYNTKAAEKVVNLKRSFDYFATIENLKAVNSIKEYIMIRQQDILLLRKVVNSVFDIFNDQFDNMFGKKNGVVTLRNKIKPIQFDGLSLGKYLVFTPDINERTNGEKEACIRMNLSSPTNFVLMNQSKLSGFLECLNNMDMFGYAQSMLNYFGRPAYGTNLYDMTNNQDIEDNVVAQKGRVIQIQAKPNKTSYFANKMKELEG
jgi:hypothetical protein